MIDDPNSIAFADGIIADGSDDVEHPHEVRILIFTPKLLIEINATRRADPAEESHTTTARTRAGLATLTPKFTKRAPDSSGHPDPGPGHVAVELNYSDGRTIPCRSAPPATPSTRND
ncbi:hypothetical protein NKG05_26070 [Oerskovia sp. M15]